MNRKKQPLRLNAAEREQLVLWASSSESSRLRLRARIILACEAQANDAEVARSLDVSPPTVAKWRARFRQHRLAGLQDAPRPGSPRRISEADVNRVVEMTLHAQPPGAGRWTTRALAKATGLTQNAIWRIWNQAGISPAPETKGNNQSESFQDAGGLEPVAGGKGSPAPTKQRILEVALRHFAELGFDGASTARIADEAGVTQPLIHHHFSTKAKLWEACVREAMERTVGYLEHAFADETELSFEEQLRLILRRFAASSLQALPLARIFNAEASRGGPRLNYIMARTAPAADAFEQLMNRGKQQGLIRDIPSEYLHAAFLGLANHLFLLSEFARARWGIDVTTAEHATGYCDAVMQIFCEGILLRDSSPE